MYHHEKYDKLGNLLRIGKRKKKVNALSINFKCSSRFLFLIARYPAKRQNALRELKIAFAIGKITDKRMLRNCNWFLKVY